MKIGSIVWGVKDIDRALRKRSPALSSAGTGVGGLGCAGPREGDGIQLSLSKVTSDKAKRHHMDLFTDTANSRRCSGFWRWGRTRRRGGFIPPTRLCGAARPGWQSILCCTKIGRVKKWEEEKGGIWIDYQRIVAEIHHGRYLHRGWGNCLPQFRQQDGGCGAVCQRTVYHLHLGV